MSKKGADSIVYKIADAEAWAAACRVGLFAGSPDDRRDGYIHLSSASQVQGTLARHFRGAGDLVLAAFAAEALGASLKWEPSRGGELFPHLYAPLPTGLALWSKGLGRGDDGVPMLAEDLEAC